MLELVVLVLLVGNRHRHGLRHKSLLRHVVFDLTFCTPQSGGSSVIIDTRVIGDNGAAVACSGAPLGRFWLVPGSGAVGGVGAGVISGAPGWPSDHALVLGRVWLGPGSS